MPEAKPDEMLAHVNVLLRRVDAVMAEEIIAGFDAVLAPREDGSKVSSETALASIAALTARVIMQGRKQYRSRLAGVFVRLLAMNVNNAEMTEAIAAAAGEGFLADQVEAADAVKN